MSTVPTYGGSIQWFQPEGAWVIRVTNYCGASVNLQGHMGISRDGLQRLVARLPNGGAAVIFYSDKIVKITRLGERKGRELTELLKTNFTAVGGGTVVWRLKSPCYY